MLKDYFNRKVEWFNDEPLAGKFSIIVFLLCLFIILLFYLWFLVSAPVPAIIMLGVVLFLLALGFALDYAFSNWS